MKTTILSLTSMILSSAFLYGQDTIPNPGLENWTTLPTYEVPDVWTTLNPLTAGLGVITATKTSSVANIHSGSHAIQLETKSISSNIAPGLMTNGIVNAGTGSIDGGMPINSRPTGLNGWYKYLPSGADTATFEIFLSKWNSTTQQSDIIGSGSFSQNSTVSSWTNFSFSINYTTSDVPDTVKINFFASGDNAPQVGSVLFLDDIAYGTASGINISDTKHTLNVYPNPAADKIFINGDGKNIQQVMIFSLDGKIMKQLKTDTSEIEMNISGLNNGNYIIAALTKENDIFTRIISVK